MYNNYVSMNIYLSVLSHVEDVPLHTKFFRTERIYIFVSYIQMSVFPLQVILPVTDHQFSSLNVCRAAEYLLYFGHYPDLQCL